MDKKEFAAELNTISAEFKAGMNTSGGVQAIEQLMTISDKLELGDIGNNLYTIQQKFSDGKVPADKTGRALALIAESIAPKQAEAEKVIVVQASEPKNTDAEKSIGVSMRAQLNASAENGPPAVARAAKPPLPKDRDKNLPPLEGEALTPNHESPRTDSPVADRTERPPRKPKAKARKPPAKKRTTVPQASQSKSKTKARKKKVRMPVDKEVLVVPNRSTNPNMLPDPSKEAVAAQAAGSKVVSSAKTTIPSEKKGPTFSANGSVSVPEADDSTSLESPTHIVDPPSLPESAIAIISPIVAPPGKPEEDVTAKVVDVEIEWGKEPEPPVKDGGDDGSKIANSFYKAGEQINSDPPAPEREVLETPTIPPGFDTDPGEADRVQRESEAQGSFFADNEQEDTGEIPPQISDDEKVRRSYQRVIALTIFGLVAILILLVANLGKMQTTIIHWRANQLIAELSDRKDDETEVATVSPEDNKVAVIGAVIEPLAEVDNIFAPEEPPPATEEIPEEPPTPEASEEVEVAEVTPVEPTASSELVVEVIQKPKVQPGPKVNTSPTGVVFSKPKTVSQIPDPAVKCGGKTALDSLLWHKGHWWELYDVKCVSGTYRLMNAPFKGDPLRESCLTTKPSNKAWCRRVNRF